ncbi:MAG: arsenic resistance N-acetyltransferase ArsN2 [Aestuariivirga sp.]
MKEEGAPFLEDVAISGGHEPFRAALEEAGLPVDDLQEPGRVFFLYRALDGEVLGYGGYELHGSDVLLRSILVMPRHRKSGIGRNILPLLLFRTLKAGAHRAYLLTQSAVRFFEHAGFRPLARDMAPPAIRETRQAAALCPASAVLMARKIEF